MNQHHLPTISLNVPAASPQPASRPLPDIASALAWRSWPAGLEEARRRQVPMLALAEPAWANAAQRLAFVLGREEALRTLLDERVVPVLLDPNERPDLAAAWRAASIALTGASGPPLMVFLSHEGLPFLSYCTMTPEGDDRFPSLASLIQSTSEAYADDPAAFVAEARQLDQTLRETASSGAQAPDWESLRPELDTTNGGLRELPKHPHPRLLWSLLEEADRNVAPGDLVAWLTTTLDRMPRGAIYDQLDRGFHRCARDEHWIVPHFEKPVPLNAQLAAVYARAAVTLGNDQFGQIAQHLVAFCLLALRDGVDVVGSDSEYYTWTAKEMLQHLDPTLVQVVSLHYNIAPDPSRQALHRAVEMEQMDRYSHEPIDVLRARLLKGRSHLRLVRQGRPAPPTVSLPALSWRAETIRWLFRASAWTPSVAREDLEAALETLIADRLDPARGYLRSREPADAWLDDQASLLAAFLEAHRATQVPVWRERAEELAGILRASYGSDAGWLDQPGAPAPSRAVVDDVIPATLSTLEEALAEIADDT